MHSRLAHGFVTAKNTVLFTAPPASAWQLCLPVLYLIPPAKLALRISLPDPWACRRRRPLCPPRWLRPGSLGSALGGLRGRAGRGRAGAHAGCYSRLLGLVPIPPPATSLPPGTLQPSAGCRLLQIHTQIASSWAGVGPGLSGLFRWNWCLSSSIPTALLNSAFPGGEGIGRNWEVGSTHSPC